MPEAVLFKIRAEVFLRSEHLLTSHKVLSSGVHSNCLQSLSEKWSVLPGIGMVGRGEGFREDFCVLLDVTQQGLPNHTKTQRKDSCRFLCGCMFRTVTKNSRGLFPSCLEVVWKLVYWQLSMGQPEFSRCFFLHRK